MGKNVLFSVFSLLLLCNIASARIFAKRNNCSTHCGGLKISSPFRLRGGPDHCGDRKFELICIGNNDLFFYFQSGNYSVLDISYEEYEIRIRIVDVGLASGSCSRPLQTLTPHQICHLKKLKSYYQILSEVHALQTVPSYPLFSFDNATAAFVSCRTMIKDSSYHPARCLDKNDAFVYVKFGYQVKDLQPNCSFLTMTPYSSGDSDSDGQDIFKILKRGFILSYGQRYTMSVGYCLATYMSFPWPGKMNINTVSGAFWDFIISMLNILACVFQRSDYSKYYFLVLMKLLLFLQAILLVGRLIFAPLTIWVFLIYQYWKRLAPIDAIEKFLRTQKSLTPTRYTYGDIIMMTSNFKEKLGQGGFGSVFIGKLPGGPLVAVKVLNNSKCDGDDFISEVSTIGRIHHINVVQLVGFCSEGSNRALVYDYMPNGSLDKYIFSSTNQRPLTHDELNNIALGVARGINYLHQGCDMQILHFDIKPHNILLDCNFTPKVSDFGLAKLYPKDYNLVSISAARGTVGYIAPELISRSFGVISYKSDVYSFGMLLLEMAGRRRNINPTAENSSQIYYPSWIYDRLNQSGRLNIDGVVDISQTERKLSKVGLWCIQMKPSDRPSMGRVVEMLESDVDALQVPPNPFISSLEQPTSVKQSCASPSSSELSIISEHE